MTAIMWAFAEKEVDVEILGDRVAYSWTCGDSAHDHGIECLWVWHNCTMELDSERIENSRRLGISIGWEPGGVGAHEFVSASPLHIEPSVYWPHCCGLHGWIRGGRWIDVNDIQ